MVYTCFSYKTALNLTKKQKTLIFIGRDDLAFQNEITRTEVMTSNFVAQYVMTSNFVVNTL